VTWTCRDDGSGATDDGGSTTLAGEGAGQSVTGTCTDRAGNSSSASRTGIDIDLTAPTIELHRSPAADDAGWNNTDVLVSWTCTDTLSGAVDTGGSVLLSAEEAEQSALGSCADKAGNTSTDGVRHVSIDKTAPTLQLSRSPAPNGRGWNNTDVDVTWTCADALSGATDAGGHRTVVTEGAGQSVGATCTDLAGNSSSDSVTGINIDKTAPTVTWVGALADGASYYFGQTPAAPTCSATDALSGVDGGCVVSGFSAGVGPHTLTATATDKAGNVRTVSRSYAVLAWTPSGFYQPVDMNNVWNVVKGGSTVPLKFEVFRGSSEITDVATLGAAFTVKGVSCPGAAAPTDDIELTTTGGTTLRYDATAGQFVQNWQTPKNAGACYQVTMTAADGSALSALFKLK
jgi:hypothetical protein